MPASLHKPNGTGIARIINATRCSLKGISAAWRDESAFRQEVVLAAILLPVSVVLAENVNHWLMLVFTLLFVLFAEIVNSAIEAVCDAVTLKHNPMIGKAKDLGSTAVFIALSFLVLVWTDAALRYFKMYV